MAAHAARRLASSSAALATSPYDVCPLNTSIEFPTFFCPLCDNLGKRTFWASEWSRCPVTCGGGVQKNNYRCMSSKATGASAVRDMEASPRFSTPSACNATCESYINTTQLCATASCEGDATAADPLDEAAQTAQFADILQKCPPGTPEEFPKNYCPYCDVYGLVAGEASPTFTFWRVGSWSACPVWRCATPTPAPPLTTWPLAATRGGPTARSAALTAIAMAGA
jgi:hypothetical protein